MNHDMQEVEVGRFTVEEEEYVLHMVAVEGKTIVLVFQGAQRLPVWGEVEVWIRKDFQTRYRVDPLNLVLDAIEQYIQEARIWQRIRDSLIE